MTNPYAAGFSETLVRELQRLVVDLQRDLDEARGTAEEAIERETHAHAEAATAQHRGDLLQQELDAMRGSRIWRSTAWYRRLRA